MSPRSFELPVPVEKAVQKLSEFLGATSQSPSRAPPTNPSHFAALPIDIIEEILLYLQAQDIVRVKQVCWTEP